MEELFEGINNKAVSMASLVWGISFGILLNNILLGIITGSFIMIRRNSAKLLELE
jgi:uncharacterized integral membrane protein